MLPPEHPYGKIRAHQDVLRGFVKALSGKARPPSSVLVIEQHRYQTLREQVQYGLRGRFLPSFSRMPR